MTPENWRKSARFLAEVVWKLPKLFRMITMTYDTAEVIHFRRRKFRANSLDFLELNQMFIGGSGQTPSPLAPTGPTPLLLASRALTARSLRLTHWAEGCKPFGLQD